MHQKVLLKVILFVFGFLTVCNAIDVKMIAHRKGWIDYGDECRLANCRNVKDEIWQKRGNYASGYCQINCDFNDACKEAHPEVYNWSPDDCYPSKCACDYLGGTFEGLDDCKWKKGFDRLSCSHIKPKLFTQ